MNPTSMRPRRTAKEYLRRLDWGAVWTWSFCFGLLVYLGLEGGGYDPLVHDQVGIAVWWVLLVGVLVGALPRRRPPRIALVGVGLLGAFVAWTALGLTWTESVDKTAADLARVASYLGIFALAVASRGRGESGRILAAVAAGIVTVALFGLISRLHPSWFPEAAQTGRFLEDSERLSYPLNYWNGMAALVAIGLPLVLHLASAARTLLARALAAAVLPALMLTLFLTLSRGGMATAAVAVSLYLVLTLDRLPKLITLLFAGAGGAFLIAATTHRDALQEGLLGPLAREQGNEVLAIVCVVCLAVGCAQAGLSYALLRVNRPGWTVVSRRNAAVVSATAALVVLVALVSVGAPGRAVDGWSEFKSDAGPGSGTGRLGSVAGQNRYQFWSSAARENATRPLSGTGSGTFEYWWARDGDTDETVRDAHSLYLQTLGETGIVGLALLAAFLFVALFAGGRELMRASAQGRERLAAALSGCTAFCLMAALDWIWQIPVLPVALLLLAALLVLAAADTEMDDRGQLPLGARIAAIPVAAAAIVAIAIPLAGLSLLRESEADARAGDLEAALDSARSAENVQPGTAAPRLQQALVLEQAGDLDLAADAALAATAREMTNWRNWLVLSRIEAERGRADAAVRYFRRARELNPNHSLFAG